MKNKMVLASFLLGANIIIGSYCICNEKCVHNHAASSNDCISYNTYGEKEYFINEYGDTVKFSENLSAKYLINNVTNFSQSFLNTYYNSCKDDGKDNDITGTCTIVACLGMVYYFGSNLNEYKIDNSSDMFIDIYDKCLSKGYTTRQDGTSKTKVNNCLTTAFSVCGSQREGNTEWYYLYDKLSDFIRNNNTPLIFDLTNHSVVACGFTSFDLSYTETYTTGMWWWKEEHTREVTTSEEFVIVNEGWGRASKSLVPTKKITNIYDGMQICYAEE